MNTTTSRNGMPSILLTWMILFCSQILYGQMTTSTKSWARTQGSTYALAVNANTAATLEMSMNSLDVKATATVGDQRYTIRRVGFWKNTIEITNDANEVIGKIYPERWLSNAFAFEYQGDKKKLLIRNNPLAEVAIVEHDTDVLSYGLNAAPTKGSLSVKIATHKEVSDYLLDSILWYVFVPIAIENFGDTFTFVVLPSL